MKIRYCKNYEEMSRLGADELLTQLAPLEMKSLCIATGNSPLGLYTNLTASYKENPPCFDNLRIVKLDEWGGIDAADKSSGEYYLRSRITEPLGIKEKNYISFQTNPASPEGECERVQKELEDMGPIDICVLGLGRNGHLGFNEPAKELKPYCHVAKLTLKTMQHSMAVSMEKRPTYGLTLGMANILNSRKIILLVSGADKQHVTKALLQEKISTYLPASLLWLHPDTSCYIDEESLR